MVRAKRSSRGGGAIASPSKLADQTRVVKCRPSVEDIEKLNLTTRYKLRLQQVKVHAILGGDREGHADNIDQ